MQIDEFQREETMRLARFVRYWWDHNAEDPDGYPLNLEPGEWDEQYIIWADWEDTS